MCDEYSTRCESASAGVCAQATNELPGDMQRLAWEKLNTYESRYI